MKRNFRKLLAAVISVIIVIGMMPLGVFAADNDGISLSVNGNLIEFSAGEYIVDSENQTVYLPFTAVMKELGAVVTDDYISVNAAFDHAVISIVKQSLRVVVSVGGSVFSSHNASRAVYDEATDEYYFEFNTFSDLFKCITGWDENERVLVVVDPKALIADIKTGKSYDIINEIVEFATQRNGKTHKIQQSVEGIMPFNGKLIEVEAELDGYVRDMRVFDITYNVKVNGVVHTVDFRSDLASGVLYARPNNSAVWIEHDLNEMAPATENIVADIASIYDFEKFDNIIASNTLAYVDINDASAWDKMAAEAERSIIRLSDDAFSTVTRSNEYGEYLCRLMTMVNPTGASMLERIELCLLENEERNLGVTTGLDIAYYDETSESYIELSTDIYDEGLFKVEIVDLKTDGITTRSLIKSTSYEEADVEIECYPPSDAKVVDLEGNPVSIKPLFNVQINGKNFNKHTIPLAYKDDTLYIDLGSVVAASSIGHFYIGDYVDMKVEDGADTITAVMYDGTEKVIQLAAPLYIDQAADCVMVPAVSVPDIDPTISMNYDADTNTLIFAQIGEVIRQAVSDNGFDMVIDIMGLENRTDGGRWDVKVTYMNGTPEAPVENAVISGIIDSDTDSVDVTYTDSQALPFSEFGIRGSAESGKYYVVFEADGSEIWLELTEEDMAAGEAFDFGNILENEHSVMMLSDAVSAYIYDNTEFLKADDWNETLELLKAYIVPISDEALALNDYKATITLSDEFSGLSFYDEMTLEVVPNSSLNGVKSAVLTFVKNADADDDTTKITKLTYTYDNTCRITASEYEGDELVNFNDISLRYNPTKKAPVIAPDEDAVVITVDRLSELIESAQNGADEDTEGAA